MKTFHEYITQAGYSWTDFDRTYEMENLIEQYADERVEQANAQLLEQRNELSEALIQILETMPNRVKLPLVVEIRAIAERAIKNTTT